MKLLSIRPQDTADSSRTLAAASEEEDRDRVRAVVRRWQPDLSDDLESTIALGKMLANESPDG